MDTVVVLATWIVVAATFMALLLSQQESVALWVTQLSGAEVQRTAVTCIFATLAGWFLSSLKYERKNAANSTHISASTEPMATVHSTSPAEASPNRIEQGAELTELLRAVGNRLEPSAFSRRTPYSETADASGSMLLLVLSSAPGPAAYSASYILPSDRFKVVVLHSLEHCLQYLEEVPYVPDCMAVEQDDLAGGAEQALRAIAAVRRRLGPADLPILRVVRGGVDSAAADSSQQCWQQQQQKQRRGQQGGPQPASSSCSPPTPASCASSYSPSMWDPAGDALLLLAPVHPAQLEAIVTARVKLRRQHQQRAAAHATLSLLRHLLPPPAFTDLVTHGSPWAARAHANVSVISAVITLELLLPRNRSTMYTVADSTAAGSVNVKGCSTPLAADCTASTAANQDDAVQLHATPAMAVMHEVCAAFDQLCEVHGITKIGLLGDTYLAAGGLDWAADHPQRVMRAAAGMLAVVEGLQAKHQGQHGQHGQQGQEQGQGQGLPEQQQQRRGREAALLGGPRMEVQIGVHAGPCVAGVVGRTKPVYTLVGDAVSGANELRRTCYPMCIHVSAAVHDMLVVRQPTTGTTEAAAIGASDAAAASATATESKGGDHISGGGGNGSGSGKNGGGKFAFIAAVPPAVSPPLAQSESSGACSRMHRTYFAKLGSWRAALASQPQPLSATTVSAAVTATAADAAAPIPTSAAAAGDDAGSKRPFRPPPPHPHHLHPLQSQHHHLLPARWSSSGALPHRHHHHLATSKSQAAHGPEAPPTGGVSRTGVASPAGVSAAPGGPRGGSLPYSSNNAGPCWPHQHRPLLRRSTCSRRSLLAAATTTAAAMAGAAQEAAAAAAAGGGASGFRRASAPAPGAADYSYSRLSTSAVSSSGSTEVEPPPPPPPPTCEHPSGTPLLGMSQQLQHLRPAATASYRSLPARNLSNLSSTTSLAGPSSAASAASAPGGSRQQQSQLQQAPWMTHGSSVGLYGAGTTGSKSVSTSQAQSSESSSAPYHYTATGVAADSYGSPAGRTQLPYTSASQWLAATPATAATPAAVPSPESAGRMLAPEPVAPGTMQQPLHPRPFQQQQQQQEQQQQHKSQHHQQQQQQLPRPAPSPTPQVQRKEHEEHRPVPFLVSRQHQLQQQHQQHQQHHMAHGGADHMPPPGGGTSASPPGLRPVDEDLVGPYGISGISGISGSLGGFSAALTQLSNSAPVGESPAVRAGRAFADMAATAAAAAVTAMAAAQPLPPAPKDEGNERRQRPPKDSVDGITGVVACRLQAAPTVTHTAAPAVAAAAAGPFASLPPPEGVFIAWGSSVGTHTGVSYMLGTTSTATDPVSVHGSAGGGGRRQHGGGSNVVPEHAVHGLSQLELIWLLASTSAGLSNGGGTGTGTGMGTGMGTGAGYSGTGGQGSARDWTYLASEGFQSQGQPAESMRATAAPAVATETPPKRLPLLVGEEEEDGEQCPFAADGNGGGAWKDGGGDQGVGEGEGEESITAAVDASVEALPTRVGSHSGFYSVATSSHAEGRGGGDGGGERGSDANGVVGGETAAAAVFASAFGSRLQHQYQQHQQLPAPRIRPPSWTHTPPPPAPPRPQSSPSPSPLQAVAQSPLLIASTETSAAAAPAAAAAAAAAVAAAPGIIPPDRPHAPQQQQPAAAAPHSADLVSVVSFDNAAGAAMGLTSGAVLVNGASMSAAELAVLLQAAGRSVGGNNSSSITFPHLQELVSATLRDAAPGSKPQVGSFSAGNLATYLQLITSSAGRSAAESSNEGSDSEAAAAAASCSRAGAGGTGAAAAGAVGSDGGGAGGGGGSALGGGRRRSADMQRALATAAAVRAAAASLPQHMRGQALVQQQQQQQQQQPSQGLPVAAMEGGKAEGASAAAAAASVATPLEVPLGVAAGGFEGSSSSASGGVMERGVLVIDEALAPGLSGTDGSSGDGGAGVPSRGGRLSSYLIPQSAGTRVRPAAGHKGLLSSLSTVPDLPTPPSSSLLTSRSRDDSRNPLTSQLLPSSQALAVAPTTSQTLAGLYGMQLPALLPSASPRHSMDACQSLPALAVAGGGTVLSNQFVSDGPMGRDDATQHHYHHQQPQQHQSQPQPQQTQDCFYHNHGPFARISAPKADAGNVGRMMVALGPQASVTSSADGGSAQLQPSSGGGALEAPACVTAAAAAASAATTTIIATAAAAVGTVTGAGAAAPSTVAAAAVAVPAAVNAGPAEAVEEDSTSAAPASRHEGSFSTQLRSSSSFRRPVTTDTFGAAGAFLPGDMRSSLSGRTLAVGPADYGIPTGDGGGAAAAHEAIVPPPALAARANGAPAPPAPTTPAAPAPAATGGAAAATSGVTTGAWLQSRVSLSGVDATSPAGTDAGCSLLRTPGSYIAAVATQPSQQRLLMASHPSLHGMAPSGGATGGGAGSHGNTAVVAGEPCSRPGSSETGLAPATSMWVGRAAAAAGSNGGGSAGSSTGSTATSAGGGSSRRSGAGFAAAFFRRRRSQQQQQQQSQHQQQQQSPQRCPAASPQLPELTHVQSEGVGKEVHEPEEAGAAVTAADGTTHGSKTILDVPKGWQRLLSSPRARPKASASFKVQNGEGDSGGGGGGGDGSGSGGGLGSILRALSFGKRRGRLSSKSLKL